jgi:glycosyltransferase involved in cell wall biosynthesis
VNQLSQTDKLRPDHMPLVSVVVPTYKRLPYLALTVRSILAQTYPVLELIVVADGHDQEVSDFVAGLRDPRAHYLGCPRAGRPAVARNFGIRHARGDYIALCDDDDLWKSEKVQRQMELMLREKLDFTFTACASIDQNGKLLSQSLLGNYGRVGKSKFILSLGGMIYNSSMLFSRSLFEKAGPFDEAPGLRSGEDYEICSRMLVHSDALGIREPLVEYRTHIGSIQPQTISEWVSMQGRIQSAILANGSATFWLWLLRYARVFYWALRVRARSLLTH